MISGALLMISANGIAAVSCSVVLSLGTDGGGTLCLAFADRAERPDARLALVIRLFRLRDKFLEHMHQISRQQSVNNPHGLVVCQHGSLISWTITSNLLAHRKAVAKDRS